MTFGVSRSHTSATLKSVVCPSIVNCRGGTGHSSYPVSYIPLVGSSYCGRKKRVAHVSPSNALAQCRKASKPLPQNPTFDQFRAINLKSQGNPDVNYSKASDAFPAQAENALKMSRGKLGVSSPRYSLVR
jgi:hypothetical protein